MPKKVKVYDKSTGEWVNITSPDVNVVATLPDGSTVKDTDIHITNVNYSDNDTLDDTLGVISDDIERLKRNVSWLAEHGGNGGSGSGSATYTSYGISLITALEGGAYYATTKKFTIEFQITADTSSEQCYYSYSYDGNAAGTTAVYPNETISIEIDNTNSTKSYHYITITAKNPYGSTIRPISFNIYESIFTAALDTSVSIGEDEYYQNNIGAYMASKYYTDAYIPLTVQCGLVGATINVVAVSKSESSTEKTFTFSNSTASSHTIKLGLWDIIDNPIIGQGYDIDISASATLSGHNTMNADTLSAQVRIVSPSELTVVLGVNGQIAANNKTLTARLNDDLSYSFGVYGPSTYSNLRYATKIECNGTSYLAAGSYFDDTLKASDTSTYKDNSTTSINSTVTPSTYNLSDKKFSLGDTFTLTARVWANDGTYKEDSATIRVIEADTNIFPRQYEENTMFASWNKSYSGTDSTVWMSQISSYKFRAGSAAGTVGSVEIPMNVLNSNGKNSGLMTDNNGVNCLRLQNKAYAIVDFSKYNGDNQELKRFTGAGSFDISFAYSYDYNVSSEHTIFLWGTNAINTDTLTEGIRIDANKVYWSLTGQNGSVRHTLEANVSSDVKITVDCSYNAESKMAILYINGEPNAAVDLSDEGGLSSTGFPDIAYIGCNYLNTTNKYADCNIYDFSLYTSHLTDLQINVNSKNNRLNGLSSSEDVISDYNTWKKKNFIYTLENDESTPRCYLWDEITDDFISSIGETQIANLYANSDIPTVIIKPDDASFSESYFYQNNSNANILEYNAKMTYYDPTTKKLIEDIPVKIYLQGTSTLGYRVKNIEIIINKTFDRGESDSERNIPCLFQPKASWLPENEFTLKADVVDSAHANNTVIGEWINNCGLFGDNPAMAAYENDENKPYMCDGSGTILTTKDSDGNTVNKRDTEATIKHTLEGFPVMLYILFYGTGVYKPIGIYSFNLGRASYYNMGMKFLDKYSRMENGSEVSCPAIIDYFEEKTSLGDVKASNIYSYEFGESSSNADYPLWSQYEDGMLKYWGEFKYPDVSTNDTIWTKLSDAIKRVALSPVGTYYPEYPAYTGYDDVKVCIGHIISAKNKSVEVSEDLMKSNFSDTYYSECSDYFYLPNFYAYFVVANAFGMTDSLGKNMVLRTWDGGQMWYPCFYDMDTALGLSNDGSEKVPTNCGIDKYSLAVDDVNRTASTEVTFHSVDSDYAAYNAKIWGLLRDRNFQREANGSSNNYAYEKVWGTLRQQGGKLATITDFIDEMESKVATCGEMIYCLDYYSKYIKISDGTDSAIGFLHGNRVEFVKNWLRKHFYYLDGAFDVQAYPNAYDSTYTFSSANCDTPLYTSQFLWTFYETTLNQIPFTLRCTTPSFIKMYSNTAANERLYYLSEENKDILIYLPNSTNANTQTHIWGASLLTKIGGMDNSGYQKMSENNSEGVIKSLSEFDISNSNTLDSSSQIDIKSFGKSASALESIDLSYTTCKNGVSSYVVDLGTFTKVLNINIEHSDVTSLGLPSTTLESLLVRYSKISNLTLKDQTLLSEIDVEGCTKLQGITVNNCDSITSLDFSELGMSSDGTSTTTNELTGITVENCDSLESIVIANNPNLKSIVIDNNKSLKSITIKNCNNENLTIKITSCTPETIILDENYNLKNTVTLPSRTEAASIKNLTISKSYYFGNITYDGDTEEVDALVDDGALDLSPMTALKSVEFNNIYSLKYVRFANDEETAVDINSGTFNECTNLERVYGHINITSAGAFANKKKFFINKMMDIPSEEGNISYGSYYSSYPHFTGDDVTNVDIDDELTSLAGAFESTSVNIGDVYYILSKCANITDISTCFKNCAGIATYDASDYSAITIGLKSPDYELDENIFAACTNVVNADGLFMGCGNFGFTTSATLLYGLVKNLTTFNDVFYNVGLFIKGDASSIFTDNNITEIQGFNPIFVDADGELSPINSNVLYNLTKVMSITNSFNGLYVMTNSWTAPCELFKGMVKLTTLDNSFNPLYIAGTLRDLLCESGQTDEYNAANYPKFVAIKNSLNISTFNNAGWAWFFGNSFFSNCKSSITTIENSFGGNAWKLIDIDDCSVDENGDNLKFPYEVLSGCSKLTSASHFFEGTVLTNIDLNPVDGQADVDPENYGKLKYEVSDVKTETTIVLDKFTFPSYVSSDGSYRLDIFDGCSSLTDASYCFSSMKYGIYSLVGEGFANNTIQNVSHIFDEGSALYCYRDGYIPYHLFYQKAGNLIADMSYAFASFEILSYAETTLFDIASYIKSGARCEPYKVEAYPTDFEDYIIENPNYDASDNTSTKYLWNKYMSDGTQAFVDNITSMAEYLDIQGVYASIEIGETPKSVSESGFVLVDDNGHPTLPSDIDIPIIDNQAPDIDVVKASVDTDKYNPLDYENYYMVRAYMCPPDLFRYCSNTYSNNITGVFDKASHSLYQASDNQVYNVGYYGVIPEGLFDGVNNVTDCSSMFKACKMILPYEWGQGSSDTLGIMFPDGMFENFADVSFALQETNMWGNTKISSIFSKKLTDASSLWASSHWYGTTMDSGLFSPCVSLKKVSSMFAGASGIIIASSIFSNCSGSITNVSSFMENCTGVTGSVPEFWDFANFKSATDSSKFSAAYRNMTGTVSNSGNIPSEYK